MIDFKMIFHVSLHLCRQLFTATFIDVFFIFFFRINFYFCRLLGNGCRTFDFVCKWRKIYHFNFYRMGNLILFFVFIFFVDCKKKPKFTNYLRSWSVTSLLGLRLACKLIKKKRNFSTLIYDEKKTPPTQNLKFIL